jgi:chromate transporter
VRNGSPLEVLLAFLKLGVTAFGGPVAHIGYFRDEIVARRRWLDDAAYSDLVALCQFLPGPSSSQVGFSLGLIRAGYWGGLAAWTGFTLPSALIMTLFAYGAGSLGGPVGGGVLHGLRLVAVAIVAQAVLGMARTLCPDRPRAAIGGIAAALILWSGSPLSQIAAILLGALMGMWLCRAPVAHNGPVLGAPVSRRAGLLALAAFAVLLAGLPMLRAAVSLQGVALFDAFYRSGALVFGGGHVVLPLLRDAVVVPGWVSDASFLAGYGAAQAIPGPLFTVAAYLGAVATPTPHGVMGGAMALVAIFLPGILILIGALSFWDVLRAGAGAQATMRGINAAVVGLLAAALYSPVWTGSVETARDASVVIVGFVLLTAWRAPPALVVVGGAAAGIVLSRLGAAIA